MDKGFISSKDDIKATLSDIMEKFIEFANIVTHDEEFLKCVNGLLPFGGVAHALMNVVPARQAIKKMGVIVMRMDMEPPLFSLAVSMTIGKDDEGLQDYSVFLTACKTIEELQEYINKEAFRDDLMTHFNKEFMCNDSPLQKIAPQSQRGRNNNV